MATISPVTRGAYTNREMAFVFLERDAAGGAVDYAVRWGPQETVEDTVRWVRQEGVRYGTKIRWLPDKEGP
jgi:hypothetical protein